MHRNHDFARGVVQGESASMPPAPVVNENNHVAIIPGVSNDPSSGTYENRYTYSNSSELCPQIHLPDTNEVQGLAYDYHINDISNGLTEPPDGWSQFDAAGGVLVGAQFMHAPVTSLDGDNRAATWRHENFESPMHTTSFDLPQLSEPPKKSVTIALGTTVPSEDGYAAPVVNKVQRQAYGTKSPDQFCYLLRVGERTRDDIASLSQAVPSCDLKLGRMTSEVEREHLARSPAQREDEVDGSASQGSYRYPSGQATYCPSDMCIRITAMQADVAVIRSALQRREMTLQTVQGQTLESHCILSRLLRESQQSAQHTQYPPS